MVEAIRELDPCEIVASWFSLDEIDSLMSLLPRIQVLVLARVRYGKSVGELMARAQAFNVRILADFDDLVFDTSYAHLVLANNDQPTENDAHINSWYAYVGRLQATAALCDGGITTNEFLAPKLAKACGGPVSIVPNFLNKRQQEFSKILLEKKRAKNFRGSGTVKIGYFSGSPTHNRDFQIAVQALCRLLKEDRDVTVRIVGFMESFRELSQFSERVEVIELQDWLNLQARIAEVDVNIAPLQLNDFTNCKSELKYFEAAVVGTFSCLSRSYTFAHAVSDPQDALIVDDWRWHEALSTAVDLVRTPQVYGQRVEKAAERAYSRYGWDCNTDKILAALEI
ncbi:glycosyltransferase [Agrobacterium tumefaciens]|uniref:glycosyltransferase n=1 Tax=Agrobacterium tumefaciens TaxID=358 RepID=UPI001573BAE7|nr:glycosyltransferase [Agrobacterium tumefaciens]NSZ86809.1 glycosyltransferase [Agrobacterium tumefaciens]WCA71992.1 glycosyltransferase [Agrobacterium tumefaciens]